MSYVPFSRPRELKTGRGELEVLAYSNSMFEETLYVEYTVPLVCASSSWITVLFGCRDRPDDEPPRRAVCGLALPLKLDPPRLAVCLGGVFEVMLGLIEGFWDSAFAIWTLQLCSSRSEGSTSSSLR